MFLGQFDPHNFNDKGGGTDLKEKVCQFSLPVP